MLKFPAWVKSKSLPTAQEQQVDKEDSTTSREERVELMDLVVTGQEGKDDYTTKIGTSVSYIFRYLLSGTCIFQHLKTVFLLLLSLTM